MKIERTKERVKQTGEVFTPLHLVDTVINSIQTSIFADPTKTFIDNSCGSGNFLVQIIKHKTSNGSTIEEALSTTYGVDLMVDNVCDVICRLYILRDYHIDVFTDIGQPTDDLVVTSLGHSIDDHPTFDWLLTQSTFEKQYTYKPTGGIITIKLDRKTDKKDGAYFTCNGVLWSTICCANSLVYLGEYGTCFDDINQPLLGGDSILMATPVEHNPLKKLTKQERRKANEQTAKALLVM